MEFSTTAGGGESASAHQTPSPAHPRQQPLARRARSGQTNAQEGVPSRRISARMKIRRLKDSADGSAVMREAVRRHPDKIRVQLEYFWENYEIPATGGRLRTVSQNTLEKYEETMRMWLDELARQRIYPRNVTELSLKHIALTVRAWEANGMAYRSIDVRYCIMARVLYQWLQWSKGSKGGGRGQSAGASDEDGEGAFVPRLRRAPSIKELLANPDAVMRRSASLVDKTPEGRGIDLEAVFAKVRLECPLTELHLRLERVFGLRQTEALSLHPIESDRGHELALSRGTKGGRFRTVPIDTLEKRQLIEQAKAVADKGGSIGHRGLTLEQAQNRHAYVVRKFGLTKKRLGVTPHGLRHGYAVERYEKASGLSAPVKGLEGVSAALLKGDSSVQPRTQGPAVLDVQMIEQAQKADMDARRLVAEELGHSRIAITGAYTGTHSSMRRHQRNNLSKWIEALETDAQLGQVVQLHEAHARAHSRTLRICLLGDLADGREPVKGSGGLMLLDEVARDDGQREFLKLGTGLPIKGGGAKFEAKSTYAHERLRWHNMAGDLVGHLERILNMPIQLLHASAVEAMGAHQCVQLFFEQAGQGEGAAAVGMPDTALLTGLTGPESAAAAQV